MNHYRYLISFAKCMRVDKLIIKVIFILKVLKIISLYFCLYCVVFFICNDRVVFLRE